MKSKTKASRTAHPLAPPTFYILWNPASEKPPTQRFTTAEEAEDAARYMALAFDGTFYVCQAVTRAYALERPVKAQKLGPPRGAK